MKKFKYHFSRLWLAIAVASYLFMPYAIRYTDASNRLWFFWTRQDLGALIFCIVLLGALFYMLFLCLHVFGNRLFRKLFEVGFIAVFGVAIVVNTNHTVQSFFKSTEIKPEGIIRPVLWVLENTSSLLIVGLAVLVFLAIFVRSIKISKSCMACSFVMSALLPIFIGNALFYKQVSHNDLPHFPEVVRNDAEPSKAKGNVYFFVFDEWSYLRSFPQKELIEPFVHLRQFQKQSVYFHKAFSYAPLTRFSMPALLFQADHMLSINNNGIGFQQADTVVPLDQVEHIFTRAQQQGYYTAMVGNYLPYREFLQGGVDFSFSKSHFKQFGINFFDIVKQHLFNTFLSYVKESKLLKIKTLRGYVLNRFFVRINDEIDAVTKKVITADAGPTFAMFHYVIPHPPFIYKKNGPTSFLKPADYTSSSGYHGNLEFLDEKIGGLMDLCKRVGKYDQSLIIMTSDHGWRFDGEAALDELCHVPLFIKFPYQDSPIEIHSPFSTVKLGMIVQDYLDGTLNISEAQAILKDPSFYVPPVSTGWDMEQLKSLFSLY